MRFLIRDGSRYCLEKESPEFFNNSEDILLKSSLIKKDRILKLKTIDNKRKDCNSCL